MATQLDIRLSIVLHLARATIWITRRVLWVLMMIGGLVSCALMRQMEFDADLHEIRFSGSNTFKTTTQDLRRLGLAYQQALADQGEFLRDGKLGDNLPELTRVNFDSQTPETIEALHTAVLEDKTHWLATHPADAERIAHAKQANAPGVFQLELPAACLFEDFDALCRECTVDSFTEMLGEAFKAEMLTPMENLLTHKRSSASAEEAFSRLLGKEFKIPRFIPLDFATHHTLTAADLRKLKRDMEDQLPTYETHSAQLNEIDSRWMRCLQVASVLELGAKLEPADFDVPVENASAAIAEAEICRAELIQLSETSLAPFERLWADRAVSAARVAQGQNDTGNTFDRIAHVWPLVLRELGPVIQLRNTLAGLGLQITAAGGRQIEESQVQLIMSKCQEILELLSGIRERFNEVPYPMKHATEGITIGNYLLEQVPPSHENMEHVLGAAQCILDGYHYIYFKILAELCRNIEAIEAADSR